MRSAVLLVLATGAMATGQWGPDLTAEAAGVQPGSDKWDAEDKADLDQKLSTPVYTDGDFFQQYFTPSGGFKTPVGEQAACIVDKASHIMNFHFCHERLARPFRKAYKQDCDRQFLQNTVKDINECCLGESHIPLWSQMHVCKHKVLPITKALAKYQGTFDSCVKQGMEFFKTHPHPDGSEEELAFKNKHCQKAAQIAPVAVKKLFEVSAYLYVRGHTLDVTDHAKDFMRVCEPSLSAKSADPTKSLYNKACRNKLATMWKKVTKESVQDDDWSN